MGAAIADRLLDRADTLLLGISRRDEPRLMARAAASGAALHQWTMDLADPLPAVALPRP